MAMLVGSAQVLANSGMFPLGDGDMANGEKIFKEGKGDVPACMTCHGNNGEGNDDLNTPRLAGQFFSFLIKQLDDFANDKRTDTTMFVMNTNAKGLTVQDRRDVATYLAAKKADFTGSDLEALKASGVEVGLVYKGKALVEYGSPVRNDGFPKELGSKGPGAPACKSCHGYAGRGAPPIYPMIGRQRYTYIVNQLKKWRDGSRANDPKGMMQAVARKLSDQDILNAASYLTGANPISLGNSHNPYERHDEH
jgi:cytochrome c553